ncbi:MAG: hypothetical protein GQ468_02865 [Candidatus Scalindua sp.]|nr:hypothetical protein [Candidatus Scalindua sp.]
MNKSKAIRAKLGLSMSEIGRILFGYDRKQAYDTWKQWEKHDKKTSTPTDRYFTLILDIIEARDKKIDGCENAIDLIYQLDSDRDRQLTPIVDFPVPNYDENVYSDPSYLSGLIDSIGLKKQEIAKLIGVNFRTLSRYLSTTEKINMPYTVQFTLECLAQKKRTATPIPTKQTEMIPDEPIEIEDMVSETID